MSIYLPGLGVSARDMSAFPAPDNIPKNFNAANSQVWARAVLELNTDLTVSAAWDTAVTSYLDLCVDAGLYPFSNVSQTQNGRIQRVLETSRFQVVQFMNRSRILDVMSVWRSHHSVRLHNGGFVVRSTAEIRWKEENFIGWLRKAPMPGFTQRDSDGVYIRKVVPGTNMLVYNEGVAMSRRWRIGYEIAVSAYPTIPAKYTPSKAELANFILNTMWLPALRSHRPHNLNHRLL